MSKKHSKTYTAGLIVAAAAAAAKWWADRLRDGAGVGDNGANDIHNVMSRVLTQQLRGRANITPEMCDKYEQDLRDRIVASMQAGYGSGDRVGCSHRGWDVDDPDMWLDVDYHPCRALYEPLVAIINDKFVANSASLPLKTRMQISPRRVIVAHGYGAKYVEIHGPVWGCSYADQRDYDDKRYALFERDCRKPWEADIEARYGKDWNYPALREAGEGFSPDSDRWQGPV